MGADVATDPHCAGSCPVLCRSCGLPEGRPIFTTEPPSKAPGMLRSLRFSAELSLPRLDSGIARLSRLSKGCVTMAFAFIPLRLAPLANP
jgi:hypothetical protein